MNLREYLITIILLLAIAVGCYHWLSQQLIAITEHTAQTTLSTGY